VHAHSVRIHQNGCSSPLTPDGEDHFRMKRNEMVDEQLVSREVTDKRVLEVMRSVPRHLFVPESWQNEAYDDRPLPIGYGQTISQPYIVACMTEALELKPDSTVLEIGTGSGYQAAILSRLSAEVYTIEIVDPLAEQARNRLQKLGFSNVHVRCGDGYRGWIEAAPFDAIILTAAPDHVPQPLIDQLKVGGHMILPLGENDQTLRLITRTPNGIKQSDLSLVRFVPMTGEAQRRPC
jgi:protein-L-isoaspartate(D-aspartate) O-methyltransferase